MIYDHFFSAALARLHEQRRYRVFADLERIAGRNMAFRGRTAPPRDGATSNNRWPLSSRMLLRAGASSKHS